MTIAQDWKTQELYQPPAPATSDLNHFAIAAMEEPPPVALTPVTLVMPVEAIQIHPNGHGELVDLDGLTASIREHGVLQPLVVSADGRLLAGRRRLEAARRAGLETVPVRLCEIADERAAIEIGLIENIERTDLDPLTRARCFRALLEQGASIEEVAALVGQESGHVYQHLALLDLHRDVQQAVETRSLSFADARNFAKLTSDDQATVLAGLHNESRSRTDSKPLSSRQIKMRVDAQRVIRLAQSAAVSADGEPAACPKGNFAALFESEDEPKGNSKPPDTNPFDELNGIIAEMVTAAQGEDQVRGWARRLSHILKALQEACAKGPKIVQDRLL